MLAGKKILIGTANGVGDIITVTPALRRLKELCPDCKISFLTRDDRKDVIEGLPYVDQVLCIKRGRFLGRFRPLPELISQDIVIFLEENDEPVEVITISENEFDIYLVIILVFPTPVSPNKTILHEI